MQVTLHFLSGKEEGGIQKEKKKRLSPFSLSISLSLLVCHRCAAGSDWHQLKVTERI